MTISSKFTLALLACVILGVMGYAFLAVRSELARSESEIVEHESATAHALRPAIGDVWSHDGPDRALELVEEARQRLHNVDVRLVSLDPAAPREKRPRVPQARLAGLVDGHDVVVVDRAFERTGRIFTYVLVHFTSPAAAAIEVSQSLAGHAAVRAEVLRSAGLTALVIATAAAFVTSLLGIVLVGRPLAELVGQARRVGEGDLSYRIAIRRRDEIAELGLEMNRMCERLRDAHESERAQADAKTRALAQLRHADRLATVGRLAAGLAHELGTPLNVVQARARQMESGTLATADVGEKAHIIVDQVARMTKLIRQLLDFARKGTLQPADMDVRALVARAVTLLEPIARKSGVSLAVDGSAEPVQGRVDPDQMTQVVLNLVMNAVQATASGKGVSVAVGHGRAVPPAEDGRSEQACIRIEVRDEGAGIASEALPRLFEPFFTTKDVDEGTGLGLSVAYGIVKDHGGWIDVASRLGEGSTFTVWLPEAGRA
jgi:two-component system, NtrC family, sensor kinase